jgi:hypothetical protein
MLILMGLRHLMSSGSAVFLNPRDLGSGRQLPHPIDLGDAPISARLVRNDNMAGFLILTDSGVRETLAYWNNGPDWHDMPFWVTTLQPDLKRFGANSLAVDPRTGAIYIGATEHVVVVENAPRMGMSSHAPMKERWFVLVACARRLKIAGECRCRPAPGNETESLVELPLQPSAPSAVAADGPRP